MDKADPKQASRIRRQYSTSVVGRMDHLRTADSVQGETPPAPEASSQHDKGPGRGKNVLLTGGTGFVGDLLTKKYLERTDCNLWILSRPVGGVPAKDRILDRIDPSDHHRIRVLEGDLTPAIDEDADDSNNTPVSYTHLTLPTN